MKAFEQATSVRYTQLKEHLVSQLVENLHSLLEPLQTFHISVLSKFLCALECSVDGRHNLTLSKTRMSFFPAETSSLKGCKLLCAFKVNINITILFHKFQSKTGYSTQKN